MSDMTPAVPTATSTEMVAEMDRDQAQAITERIRESLERWQQAGEEAYQLLYEAHEGKAWKALGHANWDEYVRQEFEKERTWSYDMLTRGFVMKAIGQTLEEIGADSEAMPDRLSFREATAVKSNLDEVTSEIRERIQEEPERAADIVKEAVQKRAEAKRRTRQEPQPLTETTVEIQGGDIIDVEVIDDEAEELRGAILRLMQLVEQMSDANFPEPERLAQHMSTDQWDKVNRARIWLLRFNMAVPVA